MHVKFVDTYGPILAQLLAKYATPDQVCIALKVCNNGTLEIVPRTYSWMIYLIGLHFY